MKRDNDRQTAIILSIVGIIPVIWLALLIAPSISGGLPEIAANLATLFDNPFSIKLCGDSLKTVLTLLLCTGSPSASIFPRSTITDDERNTVLPNGAMSEPLIKSTDKSRCQKIS